jgi:small subunit ribosomal protein S20
MANHKSAVKAARQIEKRTVINRARKSRILTFIRKVEAAISTGNKKEAQDTFRVAESEIMKGASHGVLKLNTAARKISRLCAKVKQLV